MKQCEVDACLRVEYLAHGMCDMHYKRWRKHGDPLLGGIGKRRASERFWPRVEKGRDGCWLWTGATTRGYGVFNQGDGQIVYAHRFAYETLRAEILGGLTLDHLCRVPLCVNPDHLEQVPQGENVRRANLAGYWRPNECRRGHDWDLVPPQVAHRSGGTVSRTCKVCARERRQERLSRTAA